MSSNKDIFAIHPEGKFVACITNAERRTSPKGDWILVTLVTRHGRLFTAGVRVTRDLNCVPVGAFVTLEVQHNFISGGWRPIAFNFKLI